ELAVVHNSTDGRLRGGRDLHQVQVEASCQRQRVAGCHDASLISLLVNQSDGFDTDAFVDTVVSRHSCDKSLLARRDTSVVWPGQARHKTPRNPGARCGQVDVGAANLA